MEIRNINLLPKMIASGEITTKEGTKLLASFVCSNYPIFGLQKFDEDFRSEVFIKILEKGDRLFNTFNPENGDFFTFTFCFVKSQIKSTYKNFAKNNLHDKIFFDNNVENFLQQNPPEEIIEKSISNYSKVPYAHKKINAAQLKEGIKQNKLERYDRSVLVLALKASYYLNDEQIIKISKIYNINIEFLYDLIQYFRDQVDEKRTRLLHEIECRNSAYFHHRKYQQMIQALDKTEPNNYQMERENLEKSDNYQIHNLNSLNEKFENRYLYLRPKTSSIANVLGICDRQVNYYLHCLKKGKIDKEILKKLKDSE